MKYKNTGYRGERIVETRYREKWYIYRSRNFTIADGEIDLIFVWKNTIVFVEVKVVDCITDIYDYVNYRKKRSLEKSISTYLYRNPSCSAYDIRVDVVFVRHGRIWERFVGIEL